MTPRSKPGMLTDLLALSHVPRWVTHPVSRQQYVGDHSFRTTVIAMAIGQKLNMQASELCGMLQWALVHDGPESKTGDIPQPMKMLVGREAVEAIEIRACPWYKGMMPPHPYMELVKIADTIEALSWLVVYGSGFRDRFDGENIEYKLKTRAYEAAGQLEKVWPNLVEVVREVMGEMGI